MKVCSFYHRFMIAAWSMANGSFCLHNIQQSLCRINRQANSWSFSKTSDYAGLWKQKRGDSLEI